MAASVFSSELYTRLFPVGEAGRLFTDSAEVRALQLVMGTLAKVQGQMGLIPEISGTFIHRAAEGDSGETAHQRMTVEGSHRGLSSFRHDLHLGEQIVPLAGKLAQPARHD